MYDTESSSFSEMDKETSEPNVFRKEFNDLKTSSLFSICLSSRVFKKRSIDVVLLLIIVC